MPLVPARIQGALTKTDAARVALFTKTVGAKLRGAEIDEAIEWCSIYQANPFTKDIYFFVFDEDKPSRRVVPVLSVGLYRKIAARTKDYRPDEAPPRFTYNETLIGPDNPRGIVDCEVTVYRFAHGDWHPSTSRVRWEERAPIVEDGVDGTKWEPIPGEFYPPGHAKAGKQKHRKVAVGESVRQLDPRKGNWKTMPETMLAKCTEVDAIRKGWPNETGGSYGEGELDQAEVLDLTATEIVERHETAERQRRLGAQSAIIMDWCEGGALDMVPEGAFADRVMGWARAKDRSATEILVLQDRNKPGFREFWAKHPGDALALKKLLEARVAELEAVGEHA